MLQQFLSKPLNHTAALLKSGCRYRSLISKARGDNGTKKLPEKSCGIKFEKKQKQNGVKTKDKKVKTKSREHVKDVQYEQIMIKSIHVYSNRSLATNP